MKVQLFHQVGTVLFGGLDADTEKIGDLLVLITFCNKLKNFLSWGVRVSHEDSTLRLLLPSKYPSRTVSEMAGLRYGFPIKSVLWQ